jgi:adenylate kinase
VQSIWRAIARANKLAVRLASRHVSIGRLFRESISMGTKLGVAAKHYFEECDQVPSGVHNALVAERISHADCRRRGFILDGYPRALDQAEALTRSLTADTSLDAVLQLRVSEDEPHNRNANTPAAIVLKRKFFIGVPFRA